MVNLVFIISIILLVIILLSAINVCSNSVYYNRFIDRYYSYISEPFDAKDFINENNIYLSKSMDRMSRIKINDQKINNIKNAISTLETKLNSVH
jgi:hypothetical protein